MERLSTGGCILSLSYFRLDTISLVYDWSIQICSRILLKCADLLFNDIKCQRLSFLLACALCNSSARQFESQLVKLVFSKHPQIKMNSL